MPFHVTLSANIPQIMRKGLEPRTGVRSGVMETEDGIYLFKTEVEAEDAVANWLGDEFEEMEALALLKVTLPPNAKTAPSTAEYEIVVTTPIPPKYIEVLNENF